MKFFLGPELLERVPDTCVAVVVAEGVNHARGAEGARDLLDAAAEETRARFGSGDPAVVAEVAAWRERLGRLGRAASELAARAQELLDATTTVLWVDRSTPSVELPVEPRAPDAIDRLLDRGLVELFPSRADVERRLRSGEKLRIYMGVDPTSPVI